jgi:predicted dehydrogenase
MRCVRMVVAGCSHWHTARYVAGFAAAGASFVGFEDADLALAERMATDHGARAYADVGAMLDAERPELGLVLGEPGRMILAARPMVERGIPFVAEKPLGLTSAAVFALADAVERAGLHAGVAFVNRRAALWVAQRELRDDGRLGELSHLAVRQINGPPRRYADWHSGWMLDPSRNGGGGALHNLGIHGVDAFLWLTGAEPEAVRIDGVTLSRRAHGEAIEDYGVALLAGPDGTRATIEAG